jgi:hypothetical protein
MAARPHGTIFGTNAERAAPRAVIRSPVADFFAKEVATMTAWGPLGIAIETDRCGR